MMYSKVVCAAVTMALFSSIATAQNSFLNSSLELQDGQSGVIPEHLLSFTLATGSSTPSLRTFSVTPGYGRATGAGASDISVADPEAIPDTSLESPLLGSLGGGGLSETGTLFLADLDFGQQGALAKWGAIVTAIPEPSTWICLSVGVAMAAIQLLRRRVSR